MQVSSFSGKPYAATPTPSQGPAFSSSKPPAPKFGCLETVGCCALPVLGLLGFLLFKLISGTKNILGKPLGSSPNF